MPSWRGRLALSSHNLEFEHRSTGAMDRSRNVPRLGGMLSTRERAVRLASPPRIGKRIVP